jgi:hypothetical protein
MISEEERRIEEKRAEVTVLLNSIAKLAKDLEEEPPRMKLSTLIQQIEELTAMEQSLKTRKEEKMRDWIELKLVEKKVRETIGEELDNIDEFDGIPSKEDVSLCSVKSIDNCGICVEYRASMYFLPT